MGPNKRPAEAWPGGSAPKVCRGDEDEWLTNDRVVAANSMPFVDRESEVIELLEWNLKALWKLQGPDEVDDYRQLRLCYAAQMFGAGKTTLGKKFVAQLSEQRVEEAIDARLKEPKTLEATDPAFEVFFKNNWKKVRGMTTLHVDLRGVPIDDVGAHVARTAQVELPAGCASLPRQLWHVLGTKAQEMGNMLFVHLDECGFANDAEHQELRLALIYVYNKMRTKARARRGMPWIFFFVSGKNIPLHAIGSRQEWRASPIGTWWIILTQLQQEDITTIRKQVLAEQFDEATGKRVDEELARWTAGAPRLLLYAMRYLKHEKSNISEDLDSVMAKMYERFQSVHVVAQDIFVDTQDGFMSQAWLFLIILGQLQVNCTREMNVPIAGTELTLDRLLARLNVYINPVGIKEGTFRIAVPECIKRFVRDQYKKDYRIPLLLRAAVPNLSSCLDNSKVLEQFIVHRMVLSGWLANRDDASVTWKQLLCPIMDGSQWADHTIEFNTNKPVVNVPAITNAAQTRITGNPTESLQRRCIPVEDRDKFFTEQAPIGSICVARDHSSSADTHWPQRTFVLEIQDKAVSDENGLCLSTIGKEVAKSISTGSVVLVLISLQLGAHVRTWAGKGVLTLQQGKYQATRAGELWRNSTRGKELLVDGRFEFQTKMQPKLSGTELEVREGLEVIIPSETALKQFLGEDFEIMHDIVNRKGEQVPLISRFFRFQQGPTAVISTNTTGAVSLSGDTAPLRSVLITVKLGHNGRAKQVRVCPDKNDTAEAAIRNRLRLPQTARIELTDHDDCGISIDSVTDQGSYTVSVLE